MPTFKVQAPDGMIIKVEAADEATAIRGAQEHYASKRSQPPKKASVAQDVAKSGAAGVGRGATGLAGFAGDFIGNALTGTVKNALNAASAITGRGYGTGEKAGNAVGNAYAAGVPSTARLDTSRQAAFGQDHVPQTRAGRYARTMGEFAVNAAVPGNAYSRVASVVGPAVFSEAAGERFAGTKYEAPARVAGAIVGGGLAAAAHGGAGPRVAASRTETPMQSAISEFDRAGVRPSTAAIGGKGGASIAKAIAENPIAGARSRAALQGSIDDAGAASTALAGRYGADRGAQIAGETVKSGVNRFSKSRDIAPASSTAPAKASSFAAKADNLYERAFRPIETAEAQTVDRARSQFEKNTSEAQARLAAENESRKASYDAAVAAEQQRASLATAKGAGRVVPEKIDPWTPATIEDVMPQRPAIAPTATISTLKEIAGKVNGERLSAMITDGRIRSILGALEDDAHNVRFGDIRELRTWVRNAQRDPTLRQGIPQAGLQRIEGALTQDIYNSAERLAGPQGLRSLQRADQFYRAGMTRINKALQPFDSAGSGEGAYARIMQAAGSGSAADAQKLLSVKRTLNPDEWGDIAATTIKRMGQPSKGAEGALDADAFSVAKFVSSYADMSPAGRDILFGSMGGGGAQATTLKAQLDNLVKVADKLKDVERAANGSKSAVAGQSIATIAGLANPATTLPTAGLLGGMTLTGEVMTNPAAVRALASLGAASARGSQALKSEIGRLRVAAQKNAALIPVYEQAVRVSLPTPESSGQPQRTLVRQ